MIAAAEYSHDLIHFDMKASEIKRLEGAVVPENMILTVKKLLGDRKVVQPTNQGKMLWMKSLSNLSIVDIHSFKATEVNNFWTYCGQKCTSIFVTASSDFKRFAGIGLSPEGVETLHVYDVAGGTGFASASINKMFKSRTSLPSDSVNLYRIFIERHGHLRGWRTRKLKRRSSRSCSSLFFKHQVD